jgi:ribosome maturation factor RimP
MADEFVLAPRDGELEGNEWAKAHFSFERKAPEVEAAIMALSLEQIRRTADRVAASHGLEVVEIEHVGGSKQRVLRVFIEKNREERAKLAEAAGAAAPKAEAEDALTRGLDQLAWVTHEDCERFSRDFGTVLDVEELVAETEYTLEVSSPGLDRRLTGRPDYQRFMRSLVKVQTRDPIAGNRHWQGRLTQITADGIVLDLIAKKQGRGKSGKAAETIEIAFANIDKANLIPEF